jgi:hypothetical protein
VATTFFDRARGMFDRVGSTPSKQAKPAAKPSKEFHAVCIRPGTYCCHEARALQGQRFMSHDAPQLPLRNCARETCTCRYQHYDDRRAGARRASEIGIAMDSWRETEKRSENRRGRRKTDRS